MRTLALIVVVFTLVFPGVAAASKTLKSPEAMDNVKRKLGDAIDFAPGMYGALEDADALVICTEWGVFRTPDFSKMKALLKNPVIFDGRNLYEVKDMRSEGFHYESIGREKA